MIRSRSRRSAGRAGNWNGNAGPQAECPSSCDGHRGRASRHPCADGRDRDPQHRGLYAENGAQRLHSPCRPCSGPGAGVLAAPLFQQSQSGGGPRQHLRGVPRENRRPAAGLRKAVGADVGGPAGALRAGGKVRERRRQINNMICRFRSLLKEYTS